MANNDDPKVSAEDVANQKALNDEQEKSLKTNKELSKILKGILETERNREDEIKKTYALLGEINKVKEKGGKLDGQLLTQSQLRNKETEATLRLHELLASQKEQELENTKQELAVLERKKKSQEQLTEQEEERLKNSEETLKRLEKQVAAAKSEKDNAEELAKTLIRKNNLAIDFGQAQAEAFKSTTGIGRESNTLVGRMAQLGAEGVDFSHSLKEAGQAIANQISLANVFAAIYDKLVKNTLEYAAQQDKAFASFEKKAGDVAAFSDQIQNLKDTSGAYGITIGQAAETFGKFKNNFNGFTTMTKAQQDELAKTSAQLGVLGVAEEDVIKTQELLVKGMGMSVTESTNLQKSLYGTAQAMGLPPQKVSAEFAKAAPILASHGKNMTKVFLDLQNSAKTTGIGFDELLDITSKFDTFDAAADSAGKLNAILGGDYLNSIELLNASEGDRVKILQDSLKASGKSIDQMSKQEQRATAQALGLKDVTQLQKLMNNETNKSTVELMREEEAQKKMNEAMQNAQELGEMWEKLQARLVVVIRPVIDGLKWLITVINEFIDEHPYIALVLGVIMLGLGLVVGAILLAVTAFSFFLNVAIQFKNVFGRVNKVLGDSGKVMKDVGKEAGDAGKGVGDGMKNAGDGVKSFGEKAKSAVGPILAIGFAMLMIGAGIAIAAYGLSLLVQSFAGLGDAAWPAAAAIAALSLAFVLFTVVMAVLAYSGIGQITAGILLAIGAGALMFGLGIGLAAAGLALMIASIAKFGAVAIANMPGIVTSLYALIPAVLSASWALGGFSIALGLLAIVAYYGAGAIMALSFAFLIIGAAVAIGAVGIGFMLKSIGNMFEQINKSNPENVKNAIKAIFEGISVTGLAKLSAFSLAISNLNRNLSDLIDNLSSVAKNMSDLDGVTARATVNMQSNSAPSPTVSTTTAAARSNNAIPATTATNTASSNIVPVAIYIDSKKIGEILDPRYKTMIDDKLKNINSKTVPV